MLIYLSDYFRYIFRSGKELESFANELQLIKRYLEIASIRYPGRFEVHYDIEPETEFVSIPPLLIHNFVENAIRHALTIWQIISNFSMGLQKGMQNNY